MVKVLPVNDDNTIPGTVVIVEVATSVKPDEIHAGRHLHSFRCAAATAARLEGGKWTREKLEILDSHAKFWNWLNFVRRPGSPVWVFGSSVGRSLTLLGFWDLLTSEEYVLNRPIHPNAKAARSRGARVAMNRVTKGLLITGGPPTAVVAFHRDRWKLTAVDLLNYVDASAEDMASMTGLPYATWPGGDAPLSDWISAVVCRCAVSTTIVRRLIVWHGEQELGRFSLTIAGIAMAALRHRFMHHRIELPEEQDTRDWQREAYFPGRVEALWTGTIRGESFTPAPHIRKSGDLFEERPKGPFHTVDSTSFYGGIMSQELLPARCLENRIDSQGAPPPPGSDYRSIMASVLLDARDDPFPVRRDKGSIHARGTFWTRLCGPELERAVRSGCVKQWAGWQRFELLPLLKPFADGLWYERWRAKVEGDEIVESLCKSILARLHGKFLQRAPKWTMLTGRQAPDAWAHWCSVVGSTGQVRRFRSVGWDVQIQDDGGDGEFCYPALAAWVTAHGREWLRRWINQAGAGHVLYVACDSLLVDDIGLANLRIAPRDPSLGPGALRHVSTSPNVEIRGPNNYTIGDRQVVSGRALRALRISGQNWQAERWQGLEELFASTVRDGVESYDVCGRIDRFTSPGTVGPGGWITPPYLTTEREQCQIANQVDWT